MANYPGKYLTGNHRQLMSLSKRPSASTIRDSTGESKVVADERPFFDLGEMPETHPDYGIEPPWRQIVYHPTSGEEVCAINQSQVNSLHLQGYLDHHPLQAPANPVSVAADDLAGLTQDERRRVLEAVRSQKLKDVQARLSKLSEAELHQISADPARKQA